MLGSYEVLTEATISDAACAGVTALVSMMWASLASQLLNASA